LNIDIIAEDLKEEFPQLRDLYNVHLWTITAGMIVFSAHAELADVHHAVEAGSLVEDISKYLADEYGIIESTIQVATPEEARVCEIP
jgi:Co/Zn/Cd efflux system component